jgi:hypothetical protein
LNITIVGVLHFCRGEGKNPVRSGEEGAARFVLGLFYLGGKTTMPDKSSAPIDDNSEDLVATTPTTTIPLTSLLTTIPKDYLTNNPAGIFEPPPPGMKYVMEYLDNKWYVYTEPS